MSEMMGVTFKVGGKIPDALVEQLLELTPESGPTAEDIRAGLGEAAVFDGSENFGDLDELKEFCRANELSYIHHTEAKYEYSSDTEFWTPRMGDPRTVASNQSGALVLDMEEARKLVNKILRLAKDLAFTDPDDADYEKRYLRLEMLKAQAKEMMPRLPKIPELKV